MSKRAEELANQLYPDPKLENYDDILVYRADRDNALMGRANVICVYEQAERDLADAFQAEYAKELARADLALTIEDIELLHTFLYAIKNNKHGCFTFTRLSDEQYEEVLRRFKSFKENKK